MKILKHTTETVTVEKDDGKQTVYDLDELRRLAMRDDHCREVLKEFIKFRVANRKQ